MTHEYTPSTGSVVAYVVSLLHSMPIGVELDTGTIAEALDCGIPNIISGTGAAVTHGYIIREKVGGRYLWRRGGSQVDDSFIAAHPPKNKVNVDPSLRATLEAAAASRPPAPYVPASTPAPAPREQSLSERFAVPRLIPGDDEIPVMAIHKAMTTPPPPAAPEPVIDVVPAPTRKPRAAAPEPQGIRAGLWSDGSMSIERSGRVESFTPEETTYLMRFFDKMLLRNRDVCVG